MSWIQTRTGVAFYPLAPRAVDIRIEDIAHALSNLCRFGGHCRRFLSVAEHSVNVSRFVPEEYALQALLHDATEAYLVDVPKPIKPLLFGYEEIESKVWAAVAERFGVPVEMHESVHRADIAVLLAEKEQLLGPSPMPWLIDGQAAPTGELACFAPHDARTLFMDRFAVLTGGRFYG